VQGPGRHMQLLVLAGHPDVAAEVMGQLAGCMDSSSSSKGQGGVGWGGGVEPKGTGWEKESVRGQVRSLGCVGNSIASSSRQQKAAAAAATKAEAVATAGSLTGSSRNAVRVW
jgi:hypothetical protein